MELGWVWSVIAFGLGVCAGLACATLVGARHLRQVQRDHLSEKKMQAWARGRDPYRWP